LIDLPPDDGIGAAILVAAELLISDDGEGSFELAGRLGLLLPIAAGKRFFGPADEVRSYCLGDAAGCAAGAFYEKITGSGFGLGDVRGVKAVKSFVPGRAEAVVLRCDLDA